MHLHDRGGGPGCWDEFFHWLLSDVAIVPPVRVITVALVLSKRTADPCTVPNAAFVPENRKGGVAGLMEFLMLSE